jgi:hypothetical protein
MFNSPILDLVILLSFTYFIGSLMLTTINEAIAAMLVLRAKSLKHSLENLIFSQNWTAFVQKTISKSPHIQSLQSDINKFPSYIPARNFVLTIIEQLPNESYNTAMIAAAIKGSAIPVEFQNLLLDLWEKAQAKVTPTVTAITAFEEELETYYNSAMDRATGWYKRKTRRILLLLGFVLAAVLNIDTITITNKSLKDPKKLSSIVDKIIATLPNINYNDSLLITNNSDTITIKQTAWVIDTTAKANPLTAIPNNATKSINQLKVVYNNTSDFKMGFNNGDDIQQQWLGFTGKFSFTSIHWGTLFLKIFGLFLTAFALQLGSNYWFDTLNKAINIRAAGKKPNEEKK